MLFVICYYLVCASFLILYITYICPLMKCYDFSVSAKIFTVIAFFIPLRIVSLHKIRSKVITHIINKIPMTKNAIYLFNSVDVLIWLTAGITIYKLLKTDLDHYVRYKLFLGCFSFGIFGSIISYLLIERFKIRIMIENDYSISQVFKPKPAFPFRILKFQLINIFTVSVVVLTMLILNVLQSTKMENVLTVEMHISFLKETSYGLIVLILMAAVITKLFADNTRLILNKELSVMDEIVSGRLDRFLPILSQDEFGIMAERINQMIKGLREKDVCQRRFGIYMTPEISELILKSGANLEGELVEATILFCDLRGYSSFAEKKSPHEVVQFLNMYFTSMEEAIKAHGGIVLQYIGDEIEAVFGAPKRLEEHPEDAVRCALEMRKRLSELNQKREAYGEGPVSHGIGIHTGEVLAGAIGSPTRKSYVMVGDAVNLAARLQELNKEYSSDIIISEDCKTRLKGQYQFRDLGEVKVKGRNKPVRIYQVL